MFTVIWALLLHIGGSSGIEQRDLRLSLPSLPPADLPAGPEGARLLFGLLRPQEGLQAEEHGDRAGAEEGGVPQTGVPAQEGELSLVSTETRSTCCLMILNDRLWFLIARGGLGSL